MLACLWLPGNGKPSLLEVACFPALQLSGSGWGRVLVVLTVAFPRSCSRNALPIPVPGSPPPSPGFLLFVKARVLRGQLEFPRA